MESTARNSLCFYYLQVTWCSCVCVCGERLVSLPHEVSPYVNTSTPHNPVWTYAKRCIFSNGLFDLARALSELCSKYLITIGFSCADGSHRWLQMKAGRSPPPPPPPPPPLSLPPPPSPRGGGWREVGGNEGGLAVWVGGCGGLGMVLLCARASGRASYEPVFTPL